MRYRSKSDTQSYVHGLGKATSYDCYCFSIHVFICTKEDQGDVYYYLHKKLDDNYDVISALERQLMVETADRKKAETEYARQIEELEIRKDDELGPLKQKLRAEEEQVMQPYNNSCPQKHATS